MTNVKEISILLVDDDEIDIEAIKMGFDDLKIANPIYTARDGVEALEILRGENEHIKLKKPYIILLDINMPRMSGLDFLDVIRNDQELKTSIIFILTTSDNDRDRVRAFENHVAGYLLKSNAGKDFIEAAKLLEHYWRYVEFPI